MPDLKISQLPVITTATSADIFAAVDTGSGDTSQVTFGQMMGSPGPIGGVTPDTGEFTTLVLAAGATVDEISIDGTFISAADDQLSTALAIKTYVDTEISTLTTVHNELIEIQGGDSTNRYHLTLSQYDGLTDGGVTALHTHFSDSINHNGLSGLQGGDSTSELYHLTQAVHDSLYSASPTIGLGSPSGTNLEVDYGSNVTTIDVSGTTEATFNSSGLSLKSGTGINEFSIDGTLAGDSDTAVPTEQAVKTYSDRIPNLTSEPTGFPNRTDSAIEMGVGLPNRFTISPTGGSFSYYIVGVQYTKSVPETLDISDDQGLHYIYYDGATLTESLIFDVSFLKDKAYVAAVYWDTTSNISIYLGEERHGLVMDWATHAYLHNTRGTVWNSGLALTDMVVDGTGSLDIEVQFGYTQGVIYDEDIRLTLTEEVKPAPIAIFYQFSSTGLWRKKIANVFPVLEGGATPDYSGTLLAYNEFDGSDWGLTETPDGNYVLMHYFASNDLDQKVIGVVGQTYYSTLDDAQTGAQEELESLVLTDLPFTEFTAIASVIYRVSSGYINNVQAITVSTEEGADYVDWRGVFGQSRGSVSVSDHGNLTGLGDDDHIQYSLATGSRPFVGTVSGITPTLDSHLSTKGYVDGQIGGNVAHNSTTGLQGGDSTADEFYHLTQSIHDGLFSASPVIGLGSDSGTNLQVDYGGNAITADVNSAEVINITETDQLIGTSSATRMELQQSSAVAELVASDGIIDYEGTLEIDAIGETLQISISNPTDNSFIVMTPIDVSFDINGTPVLFLEETAQRIGVSGDTYLSLDQSADTFDIRVANQTWVSNRDDYLFFGEDWSLDNAIQWLIDGSSDHGDFDIYSHSNHIVGTSLVGGSLQARYGAEGTDYIQLRSDNSTIILRVNSTDEMTISTGGMTLKTGATVNELSIDGTLAGDSDTAVPTEKAVKTYVDTQITTVDEHNELQGLQGGDSTSEYYHFDQQTHDQITSTPTAILLSGGVDVKEHSQIGDTTIDFPGFPTFEVLLHMQETFGSGVTGAANGINIFVDNLASNGSTETTGITSSAQIGTSTLHGTIKGGNFFGNVTPESAVVTNIIGVSARAAGAGDDSTITNMIGGDFDITTSFAAVNVGITNAIGIQSQLLRFGSGEFDITNGYGALIKTPGFTPSGTLVNLYGLYIEDQSTVGFTTDYNIYSAGVSSENKFEGNVDIDGTLSVDSIDSTALVISGDIHCDDLFTSGSTINVGTGQIKSTAGNIELYQNGAATVRTYVASGVIQGIEIGDFTSSGSTAAITSIYHNAGNLTIKNNYHNGFMSFQGEDSGGVLTSYAQFKDVNGNLYNNNKIVFQLKADGFQAMSSDGANALSITAQDNGVGLIRNLEDGGSVLIQADNLSAGVDTLFWGHAGGAVELYNSGTKVFETTFDGIKLNLGAATINEFSTDGTLSGDSDTAVPTEKAVKSYVDTQVGAGIESGNVNLSNGDTTGVVIFAQQQGSEQYSQSWSLENSVDNPPSIYGGIVFDKSVDGFRVLFSGEIDSDNYVLSWSVVDAQLGSSSSSSSSSSISSSSSSISSSSSSSAAIPLGARETDDGDIRITDDGEYRVIDN